MIEKTLDPSFHGVVGGDRDILAKFVESHPKTYEKLRIASERIFAFSTGLNMLTNHFFYEPYDDHIDRYMAAGLADKSMKTHYSNLKQQIEISKEEKEPEVLTMDQLGAAFVICFIPAIFGLIAFICELSYARHIKRKQELESKVVKIAKIKKKNEIQNFEVELDTSDI